MDSLISKAKELLESKSVNVVIGYEEGPTRISRPAFITDLLKTEKLIYNKGCTKNLAVYLTKEEVKDFGKTAIVATLPIMRSIMVLISEQQVSIDNLKVLGISDDGRFLDVMDLDVMRAYIAKSFLSNPIDDSRQIADLKKLTPDERFKWWQDKLSKCIKCYACRQACPMCYCTRCAVEVNQPQWIPVKANVQGNMEWHILRAMHLAGRCIGCGECGKACPVGIPCHLLTMYMSDQAFTSFKVQAGTTEKTVSALSTYDPNDKESFII
ncbi:MAG TPA: 4Fe-4S dicluster domain-containing protein [Bacteroidales bacterium]|nr:4Fe-4S dicluster domain-containing protein [Bacteroidales bacterium]